MFLPFDASKLPYCSFFSVCHCIVIHCLATKHSCTASSHSTVTLHTVIHLHHQSIQSHTAQSFCSTIIHCSHTAQSHCAQPYIFSIRAVTHRLVILESYSTIIQCSHTAVTLYCHTSSSQSYIIITAYSHTLLGHSAVIQHHYTLESHSTVTLY